MAAVGPESKGYAYASIAKVLLDRGADPTAVASDGRTALEIAWELQRNQRWGPSQELNKAMALLDAATKAGTE